MLTGAEDIIVLSRPSSISCATSHKTCQQLPYNKRHPILGCLLMRDPWVLPAKPDIPPTAAPPEASYRRPEDIIVLSRSPRIPCTTSHKTCHKLYDKRHPILGCLLMRDPWVWPDNPAYPPWPHLQKLHTEGQRTLLFYLAHPGYHALLHIKHATNSMTEGTPYRVPSGQDPWVWPDNPAYPPWPHLRYPLTSKDEDPNKKTY